MVDLASFVVNDIFSLETKHIGVLYIKHLSFGVLKKLTTKFKKLREANNKEFIDYFISLVAHKKSHNNAIENLTSEEIEQISSDEINIFSEKYIEYIKNYQLENRITEGDSIAKNEDNKKGDETNAEYLQRVIASKIEEMAKTTSRIVNNFSNSIAESILKSVELSTKLGDSLTAIKTGQTYFNNLGIRKIPEIGPLNFPRNPIHDTNDRLEEMLIFQKNIEPVVCHSVELLREMNKLGIEYAGDFKKEAKKSYKLTISIVFLTIFSLLFAGVSLYRSVKAEMAANESTARLIKVLENINDNIMNHGDDIANKIRENADVQNKIINELNDIKKARNKK